MMTKKYLSILFLLALLLVACATAQDEVGFAPAAEAPIEEFALEEAMEAPAEPSAGISEDIAQTSLQAGNVQERLIIREGSMVIVVEDTEESLTAIASLAAVKEGWVVNSDVFQTGEAKSGNITIRVPADQFETMLAEVRELALEVTSESTSSQDVTEEFVDLEARVANLEATADRVRNFLDEAKTVEEALAVNAELSRLEGEIESLKARMKFLSESAAFSRLTISLTPDVLSQPIEIGGWRPEGVARSALEALVSALQTVVDVLIWVVIFCLPIAILIGVPAFFIGRAIYRRWQRRRDEKAELEEPDEASPDEADSAPDEVEGENP